MKQAAAPRPPHLEQLVLEGGREAVKAQIARHERHAVHARVALRGAVLVRRGGGDVAAQQEHGGARGDGGGGNSSSSSSGNFAIIIGWLVSYNWITIIYLSPGGGQRGDHN